jgi:hypothetical protein
MTHGWNEFCGTGTNLAEDVRNKDKLATVAETAGNRVDNPARCKYRG